MQMRGFSHLLLRHHFVRVMGLLTCRLFNTRLLPGAAAITTAAVTPQALLKASSGF